MQQRELFKKIIANFIIITEVKFLRNGLTKLVRYFWHGY